MTDLLAVYAPRQHLLYSAVLADVLDGLGHRRSSLPPELRPLKHGSRIFGRAATLNCVSVASEPARPYAVEMACVDALREGDVLIATTNGDRGSALWGELLSTAARARGAVGAVIDGLTRDVDKIIAMDFPVFAAGYSPLDSKGRLDGVSHGEPIRVGSCAVRPGDLILGDSDGVVVVPMELAVEALDWALEKVSGEDRVRAELARGRRARDVFDEYHIL